MVLKDYNLSAHHLSEIYNTFSPLYKIVYFHHEYFLETMAILKFYIPTKIYSVRKVGDQKEEKNVRPKMLPEALEDIGARTSLGPDTNNYTKILYWRYIFQNRK